MTRVQRSTDPRLKNTQVMYRDVYKKLWMYFWFLNFFNHTANMWNFETNVIKRDAHVSLLKRKFLGYRESKEEKKGIRVVVELSSAVHGQQEW